MELKQPQMVRARPEDPPTRPPSLAMPYLSIRNALMLRTYRHLP